MERLIKSNDKECMKMAILKHEQTFKEQVYELHRLYRIQKTLMRSIDRERSDSRNRTCLWQINDYGHHHHNRYRHHHLDLDQRAPMTLDYLEPKQPAKEYIFVSDGGDEIPEIEEEEDESEIELSLGPSSYNPRKKPGTPTSSDSGRSLSSPPTGSNIHHHTASRTHELGRRTKEDRSRGPEYYGQKQQREQQPPWLFQVLSLNIT